MRCLCQPELARFIQSLQIRSEELQPLTDQLSDVPDMPGVGWLLQMMAGLRAAQAALDSGQIEQLMTPPAVPVPSVELVSQVEAAATFSQSLGIDLTSPNLQQQVDLAGGNLNHCAPALHQLAPVIQPLADRMGNFVSAIRAVESTHDTLGVNLLASNSQPELNSALSEFAAGPATDIGEQLSAPDAGNLEDLGMVARLANAAKLLGANIATPSGIDRVNESLEAMNSVEVPELQVTAPDLSKLAGMLNTLGTVNAALDIDLVTPGAPVPDESLDLYRSTAAAGYGPASA